MSALPPSQNGKWGATTAPASAMNRLKPMPHANAWRNTCLALEKSLAPMKWATCTEKPTDTAERMEPISHVVVSIRPMLADCAAPRCPTMAASMKNIITVVIWASIDGMLKSMMRLIFSRLVISSPLRILASKMSLFFMCFGFGVQI